MLQVLITLPVSAGMSAYWARLRSAWCPFCAPKRTRATIIDPMMSRDWELRWER